MCQAKLHQQVDSCFFDDPDYPSSNALHRSVCSCTFSIYTCAGFFDPLGLSAGISQNTFKRWRESELKHGRLAMIAASAILVSESFHPLWNGVVSGPAINHFAQMDKFLPGFWLVPTLLTGIFELTSISKGWASPKETAGTMAWLKEDYTPVSLSYLSYDLII